MKPWHKSYEKGVPPTLTYPSSVIPDLLRKTAAQYPNRDAVVYFGNRITYREIDVMANRLAQWLIQQGVKKGDRVALFLPNTPQTIVAYYGVLKMGAVVVQTNPLYTEEELEHQMKDCRASVMITLDLLYDKIQKVQAHTHIKTVMFLRVGVFLPPRLKLL